VLICLANSRSGGARRPRPSMEAAFSLSSPVGHPCGVRCPGPNGNLEGARSIVAPRRAAPWRNSGGDTGRQQRPARPRHRCPDLLDGKDSNATAPRRSALPLPLSIGRSDNAAGWPGAQPGTSAICLVRSALLAAHFVVGEHFQRPHHGGVVPFGTAVGGAGVEQLLARSGIGQADLQRLRTL
jgi:hypothetical protein